jgi:hypothetical protein
VPSEGKYQLVGDAGKVRRVAARRGACGGACDPSARATLARAFFSLRRTPKRVLRAAADAPCPRAQKNGEKKLRRRARARRRPRAAALLAPWDFARPPTPGRTPSLGLR